MLRFRNSICLLLLMIVGLTACQSDAFSTHNDSKSGFYISLCDDVSVDSRATPSELGAPVASNFDLKITNKETGNLLYDGKFTDGLIPAAQGEYRIVASCGSNLELGLDAPYYEGTADGVVETDKATTVSVQCRVANALASVIFSNSEIFEKEFSSYALKVSVGLQYVTLKPADNKSAYYRAGAHPSFAFVGVMTDGTQVEIPIENEKLHDESTFAAAAHCKITLTMEAASGLKLKIEKVSVEKVTVNETIPVEWLPKPKVSGFSEITYVETDDAPQDAEIDYTASLPIQDMELTLNMQDEQYSAYNKTYTLSTLSDADRTDLGKLGIELPEVGEVKTGTINLQNLIGTMQTNAGTTVDNTFRLRVKANNRWSDETTAAETYTVKVVKPEFTVSVYPGNIWTKEFTVNPLAESEVTKGNFEKINSSLEYQYSADGQTWLNMLGIRQEGLTPNTQYFVRAVYRNVVYGDSFKFKTYPIVDLANGNLSSYSVTKGKDGDRWNGYGSLFQWDSWATLNELTVDHCPITAYSYNTRSGTRPTSDVRSGSSDATAAWIITIGYGYGGTNNSPNSKTPGELFLGVYNTKGIEYASHPTGVKFYYKYSPFKEDKSDIYVQVLNDNTVLGVGSLQESGTVSNYKEYTMDIDYANADMKLTPNKLVLVFKSGFNNEVESRESGGLTSANTANPKFRGSELYIDDISLVYDK